MLPNNSENCPICDNCSPYLWNWEEEYKLFHCKACETLFTHPMPSEKTLKEFYQGFLFNKPSINKLNRKTKLREKELKKFFDCVSWEEKTFLDYGAGTGTTALAAANLGLDTSIFEIDKQAVNFIKKTDTQERITIYSELSALKKLKFDFIFCDNVIEHVVSPKALAKLLIELLNPDGILLLKTPRMRNIRLLLYPQTSLLYYARKTSKHNDIKTAFRAMLFRTWCIDPPRHLFSLSLKSLNVICNYSAVSIIENGTCSSQPLLIAVLFKCLIEAKCSTTLRIVLTLVLLLGLPVILIVQVADILLSRISAMEIYVKIQKREQPDAKQPL